MMTQDLLQQHYDESDRTGLDEIVRISPIYGEVYKEAYRCPVSTPSNTRRNGKQNIYVAYTNGNRRSLQIPSYISNPQPKHNVTTLSPFNTHFKSNARTEAKPRKKNLDYYYTRKANVRVLADASPGEVQSSGWLKALCSQPVDEIFGKYKTRSDYQSGKDVWARNISTPGERALVQAWSSNVSSRASSSVSHSVRSEVESSTANSRASLRLGVNSLRVGSSQTAPSFALMPVTVHKRPKTDKPNRAPREKEIRRYKSQSSSHPSEGSDKMVVDEAFYDQFKRGDDEKRFPELKARRSPDMGFKQRKLFRERSEVTSPSPSLILHHELDNSMIQVYPLSQLMGNKKEGNKSQSCTFCVAVNSVNEKLPVLDSRQSNRDTMNNAIQRERSMGHLGHHPSKTD